LFGRLDQVIRDGSDPAARARRVATPTADTQCDAANGCGARFLHFINRSNRPLCDSARTLSVGLREQQSEFPPCKSTQYVDRSVSRRTERAGNRFQASIAFRFTEFGVVCSESFDIRQQQCHRRRRALRSQPFLSQGLLQGPPGQRAGEEIHIDGAAHGIG